MTTSTTSVSEHLSQSSQQVIPGTRVRRSWVLAVLYVALSATNAQAGDADTERENLARIASEIERVQVMVAEAAQTAPTGERVKFRYDWLLRDLGQLREGITSHVDAPRQPRPVPPLRGDYRQ